MLRVESGEAKRLRTRAEVRRAWMAVTDTLTRKKHPEIVAQVRRHVERMPPPLIEKGIPRLTVERTATSQMLEPKALAQQQELLQGEDRLQRLLVIA